MSPQKITLDEVVRDSREMLEPELVGKRVDWDKVDAALFARVATEAKARGALAKFEGRRSWAAAAAVLALAAAIPMMLGRSNGAPMDDASSIASHADRSAGALAWKDGAGEVRIGPSQLAASAGSALAQDDAVETHGVRAVFERKARGTTAVTWSLEDSSRVSVKGTRGALVLALEHGAVEAQVTPVERGEAFAVDVDGARVAVHGTHLRVARDGTRVIVDLSEGVVSIGVPPRSGSTYGQLVNAPAHIEFDANDPQGTLKVSHAADRVRAALALRPAPETAVTVTPRAQIALEAGHPSVALPIANRVAANAPPPKPAPEPGTAPVAPSAPAEGKIARAADTHPEQAIAAAVRDCVRASAHPEDDVVITVSSKLELHVGNAGLVESAKFVPPLPPEVQTCASTTIYKTRFTQPGPVTIPLDFQR